MVVLLSVAATSVANSVLVDSNAASVVPTGASSVPTGDGRDSSVDDSVLGIAISVVVSSGVGNGVATGSKDSGVDDSGAEGSVNVSSTGGASVGSIPAGESVKGVSSEVDSVGARVVIVSPGDSEEIGSLVSVVVCDSGDVSGRVPLEGVLSVVIGGNSSGDMFSSTEGLGSLVGTESSVGDPDSSVDETGFSVGKLGSGVFSVVIKDSVVGSFDSFGNSLVGSVVGADSLGMGGRGDGKSPSDVSVDDSSVVTGGGSVATGIASPALDSVVVGSAVREMSASVVNSDGGTSSATGKSVGISGSFEGSFGSVAATVVGSSEDSDTGASFGGDSLDPKVTLGGSAAGSVVT